MTTALFTPKLLLPLALAALTLGGTAIAAPDPYAVLHDFGDQSVLGDGTFPNGLISGTDGNFYGTTQAGGAAYGTVFQMTPQGQVTILHTFSSNGLNDGISPDAGLVQGTDGNFYGTTATGGGPLVGGTVFKMTPQGDFTTLHVFQGPPNDGNSPQTSLIQGTDGNFYGTTYGGGGGASGIIYKITSTGTYQILHTFLNGTDNGGEKPNALVQATDGNFYGTTYGGGPGNTGVIFQMTPTGIFTVLHTFLHEGGNPKDGYFAFSGLIQASDGQLYGTVSATNQNVTTGGGIVYRISLQGVYTILHTFATNQLVYSGLVEASNGILYGSTHASGSVPSTLFKMTLQGAVTTLHTFGTASGDEHDPDAGLVEGDDGALYGTTALGTGPNGKGSGTAFRLVIATQNQTVRFPLVGKASLGQTVTLAATSTSGLPITYSMPAVAGSTGSATLSGNQLTFTGVGKLNLVAEQTGNVVYKAALKQQNLLVKIDQVITFPTLGQQKVGGSVKLAATSSSGLPITYSIVPVSGYTGTATIFHNTVTFTHTGYVRIVADQAGTSTYFAAAQVRQNVYAK